MRKLFTSLFLLPLVCLAIDQGSTHIKGTLTVDSAVDFVAPNFQTLQLDTTPTLGSNTVGRMYWDSTNQTLAIDMTAPGGGNNVTQQVGLENYIRVLNKTGSPITNGQAVYISGAQGQRPKVALAKADSHITSKMIGIATHDIADNGEGFITTLGTVGSVNTGSFSDGDILYLSASTAGALTKTPPASPNIVVQVGVCEYSNNSNGKIHIHVAEPMWADTSLSLASDTMTASSLAVKTYIDTHKNLTGANVHGLGTISTQAANNVAITGGSVTGITDLAVADGGTGSSTAAAAIVAIGGKAANGFVNRTDSALSMSGSTFQVTTSGSYDFYTAGTKFTKNTTQSVSISNDLTLHYVYFDTSGALQVSAGTAWSITSDNVPVAMVYKDGSTYCIMDERHGWKRDRDWHAWAHETIGTRWHTGLAATFTDTTLSVTSGEIDDEDIHHAISTQLDSPRIWFRNSTTSMKVRPSSKKPYASVSGTDIAYDSSGTLTQVTNNYYTAVYLYATNDQTYPLYIVAGQAQYNTIAAARAEALPTIQLPSAEWKLLYKAIYKSNGASAPTYQEAADYRTTQTLALTATATDHQSLTNRDSANSHPQAAITGLTTSDSAVFMAAFTQKNTDNVVNELVRLRNDGNGYGNGTRLGFNSGGVGIGYVQAYYKNESPIGFYTSIYGRECVEFVTSPDGGATPAQRMKIDSSGNVTHTNFTKLGGDSYNPAIKIKKLTYIPVGQSQGDIVGLAHGLTYAKIISISALIFDSSTDAKAPEFSRSSGYQYSLGITSTNIFVAYSASNSSEIINKPIVITIIYEE